jgi:hypothetical protein
MFLLFSCPGAEKLKTDLTYRRAPKLPDGFCLTYSQLAKSEFLPSRSDQARKLVGGVDFMSRSPEMSRVAALRHPKQGFGKSMLVIWPHYCP